MIFQRQWKKRNVYKQGTERKEENNCTGRQRKGKRNTKNICRGKERLSLNENTEGFGKRHKILSQTWAQQGEGKPLQCKYRRKLISHVSVVPGVGTSPWRGEKRTKQTQHAGKNQLPPTTLYTHISFHHLLGYFARPIATGVQIRAAPLQEKELPLHKLTPILVATGLPSRREGKGQTAALYTISLFPLPTS